MSIVLRDKPLRVQGSRSRNGCQNCKLRHVKCDETAPVCARCFRTKRICRYEDSNSLGTAGSKFVVYTIPKEPSPSSRIPSHERRTLWHFHNRTLEQIEGPFRSELWSTIVPQLIEDNTIVRQAVLALTAFHEHFLDDKLATKSLPDHALQHYQKARQQIISLESPDDFFDAIVCACIIFCTCEGLRGDFAGATRHAMAGMKMIAARAASTPSKTSILTNAENTLSNVFLSLQSQVMEANIDDFQIDCSGWERSFGDVPDRFENMEQALSHIQILINQIFELYQHAEVHHETQLWVSSLVSQPLQAEYELICSRYHTWERAFSRIEEVVRNRDRRHNAGHILLKIFAFSLKIYLYVFVHGEAAYDDLKETNFAVLNLIAIYLQIRPDVAVFKTLNNQQADCNISTYKSSSFTSSPEVIPVLFEVATRTNDLVLRQKAVQLLRSSNRREGIWDGRMAASLAEQIVLLKQQGAEAAKKHDGYKFLITDIRLLSERKCLVRSGFKRIRPGSFDSFWLETIGPDQGSLRSQILMIT